MKRLLSLLLIALVGVRYAYGQITGQVLDKDSLPVSMATLSYKGHHITVISDAQGKFSIARHEGWSITISAVGMRTKVIKITAETPARMTITMRDDPKNLSEVVIKKKRKRVRYSRKDNPAVELMRRVIAAKKRTDLENHDFYQYDKYQKMTLALDDIKPEDLESEKMKKKPWLLDQIEISNYNQKLVLPISVDETVTQYVYRKNPKDEKSIITGQQTSGVNQILQTGDILNTTLKEVFQDINIYDDHVRLLQYPFPSPIGNTAISFYRFYIDDTLYVDKDKCYHLEFIPNNQQDFGFRGELYVLADSSLHVKRCVMTMPHKSDVNYVDEIHIDQEYTQLDNGEWVLSKDDMWAEIKLANFFKKLLVVRNTRLTDYAFDPLPKRLFRGKAKITHEADARMRDKDFWNKYRSVEMTKSESSMNTFVNRMKESKNFKWVLVGYQAILENYIETGDEKHPSKWDWGPLNASISHNYVDGTRLRLSGRTTGALSKHLFFSGFGAYGTSSKKPYYRTEFTYAFNKKENSSFEFPQRNISFESTYDVMSMADRYLLHDKDNVFANIKSQSVKDLYFYNRQKLSYIYETEWGLSFNTSLKWESNQQAGQLRFIQLADSTGRPKFRTTQWQVGFRICPGQTFINTKQRRWPINLDSPEFTIDHIMGLKHFMGGQYTSNQTNLGLYKRQWLGSWGYIDAHINLSAQWNQVPYPLLMMPPTNISYISDEETFSMLRNQEFLIDRMAFWSVAWDLNGKLLNRIPLIHKLKWREIITFKGFFGKLTDHNNPFLEQNKDSKVLFAFPSDTYIIDSSRPYMELSAGVHNILKLFGVEWVHRMNYNDHAHTRKNGVRFGIWLSF